MVVNPLTRLGTKLKSSKRWDMHNSLGLTANIQTAEAHLPLRSCWRALKKIAWRRQDVCVAFGGKGHPIGSVSDFWISTKPLINACNFARDAGGFPKGDRRFSPFGRVWSEAPRPWFTSAERPQSKDGTQRSGSNVWCDSISTLYAQGAFNSVRGVLADMKVPILKATSITIRLNVSRKQIMLLILNDW